MKPRIPIEPGRVVMSRAGRDAGRGLLVLAMADAEHALVADGRLRTVVKPKRKKLRHLVARPTCAQDIARRYAQGAQILDAEIRSVLEQAGVEQPNALSKEG